MGVRIGPAGTYGKPSGVDEVRHDGEVLFRSNDRRKSGALAQGYNMAWWRCHDRRWQFHSDKELREVQQALATAPSAGNNRAHEMIAEITVEANARGPERAEAILAD